MKDERDTGIPTRAIHELYLQMQEAHQNYRRVRDYAQGSEDAAHARYQDAVLSFYELIRPHLKRKGAMGEFWYGELPNYPDRPWASVEHAQQFCLEKGTAIWQIQKHTRTVQLQPAGDSTGNQTAVADGGAMSLSEWHDRLNLGDMQRVVSVAHEGSGVIWTELRAVAGLRQLDGWTTQEVTERKDGSGFMASQVSTTTNLQYVPEPKLTQAKRLLSEATDKMNLLSQVDIDHESGAIVNFDMSRDDVSPEYRTADYDSSPEI